MATKTMSHRWFYNSIRKSSLSSLFKIDRIAYYRNSHQEQKSSDNNRSDTHCIAVILHKNKNNPFLFIFN